MVFSEKFALFANSVAYFSWIIFFNSIFKWLKPRLIENNLILAKNPKNQCLKFSDFSTKSGSVVKGLVILKLNVPNFGPFYFPCYFSILYYFYTPICALVLLSTHMIRTLDARECNVGMGQTFIWFDRLDLTWKFT